MTASCVRRRWPAATAPTSTSAPASRVSEPVAASAAATWSSRSATAARTSATRMPVTLGRASVTARSRAPWSGRRRRARSRYACAARGQQAGAGDHGEVQRQRAPGDVAQAGDPQVDVAAQHVDPDGVADTDAPALGQAGVERDQRRAAVVGRPPVAGDDPRAGRRGGGIGQAAVAAQRPARCRAWRAPGRPARRARDDAGAQAGTWRRSVAPGVALAPAPRSGEAGCSGCR